MVLFLAWTHPCRMTRRLSRRVATGFRTLGADERERGAPSALTDQMRFRHLRWRFDTTTSRNSLHLHTSALQRSLQPAVPLVPGERDSAGPAAAPPDTRGCYPGTAYASQVVLHLHIDGTPLRAGPRLPFECSPSDSQAMIPRRWSSRLHSSPPTAQTEAELGIEKFSLGRRDGYPKLAGGYLRELRVNRLLRGPLCYSRPSDYRCVEQLHVLEGRASGYSRSGRYK